MNEILSRDSIVCIQEHWLYNYEAQTINDLFPSYDVAIKCSDDDDPLPPTYKPRGFAGVAVMWHKDISPAIKVLPDGGNRLIAIQCETDAGPLTLINTYMPTEGTKDATTSYQAVLDEVMAVITRCADNSMIIWTGDLNASMIKRSHPTKNDKLLESFCMENNLSKYDMPNQPTYHHFTGLSSSQLDYFLRLSHQRILLENVNIDKRHPCNNSAHDAVKADLIPKIHLKRTSAQQMDGGPHRIRWDKVNMKRYKTLTGERLKSMLDVIQEPIHPELLILRTNEILKKSASDAEEKPKPRKKRQGFQWDRQLKPYVTRSKKAHWEWKQQASPIETGSSANIARKDAKKQLRRMQRQLAAEARTQLFQEIMDSAETDRVKMFKLIRKQAGKVGSRLAQCIIEFKGNSKGANGWMNYFEDLATPKWYDTYDKPAMEAAKFKHLLIASLEHENPSYLPVLEKERIGSFVQQLNNGKAADAYGIAAEHIKYASNDEATAVLFLIINGIFPEWKIPFIIRNSTAVASSLDAYLICSAAMP